MLGFKPLYIFRSPNMPLKGFEPESLSHMLCMPATLPISTKPHHMTMKPPTCQSVEPFFGFFLHLHQTAHTVSRWACNDPEGLLSIVHCLVLNGRRQAIRQQYKYSCSLIVMVSNILPAALPCPLGIYEVKKAFSGFRVPPSQ